MKHGGRRENAGRKKGVGNLLTKELREQIDAAKLIKFLQRLADGKIKGATISERKDAANALLRKVMPDMGQLKAQIEHQHFEPVIYSSDIREAVEEMKGEKR